jgi:hypothetical protein
MKQGLPGDPVTASTGITRLELWRKVRCHSESLETEFLAALIGAAGDLPRGRRDLGAAVLSDLFLRPNYHKITHKRLVKDCDEEFKVSRETMDNSRRKGRALVVFNRLISPPLR